MQQPVKASDAILNRRMTGENAPEKEKILLRHSFHHKIGDFSITPLFGFVLLRLDPRYLVEKLSAARAPTFERVDDKRVAPLRAAMP